MVKTQEIDHSQVLKLVEKEDVKGLIAVLKTSKNYAVLQHAILFLGGRKEQKAVEPLIALLHSEFVSVRHYSALALGQIGDKKAFKPLSMLLTQAKQGDIVRKEVLKSLVLLDDLELKEIVSNMLAGERGSEALAVLKEIGQPAVKYLVDALSSSDSDIIRGVVETLGEIGLKGIRLHDCRHTHASLLLKQNIHPLVVSQRLGHANIQTTLNVYSHVMPILQTDAALKFDELISKQAVKTN